MVLGTLFNVMYQPGWEEGLGENEYTHIHIHESVCCSPTFQYKMFLVLKKRKKERKKERKRHVHFSIKKIIQKN